MWRLPFRLRETSVGATKKSNLPIGCNLPHFCHVFCSILLAKRNHHGFVALRRPLCACLTIFRTCAARAGRLWRRKSPGTGPSRFRGHGFFCTALRRLVVVECVVGVRCPLDRPTTV